MRVTPTKSDIYVLRKLPLWGTGIDSRPVDFEWPTQEQFDQMKSTVTVRAITFKNSRHISITSVQLHMSDGTSSPEFTNGAQEFGTAKKIVFPHERRVRSVRACDSNNRWVYLMEFLDDQGALIDTFVPTYYRSEHPVEHQLGESEEIIGVYGTRI